MYAGGICICSFKRINVDFTFNLLMMYSLARTHVSVYLHISRPLSVMRILQPAGWAATMKEVINMKNRKSDKQGVIMSHITCNREEQFFTIAGTHFFKHSTP